MSKCSLKMSKTSHKNLKMSKHNIIECQKCQNFNQKCQKCHPKILKCQMSKTPFAPPYCILHVIKADTLLLQFSPEFRGCTYHILK